MRGLETSARGTSPGFQWPIARCRRTDWLRRSIWRSALRQLSPCVHVSMQYILDYVFGILFKAYVNVCMCMYACI